jgi:hypothetical protein
MKLLQRLHLLPADDHRFGFWRSLLASLVTGLVLSTLVIQISEEDSFSLRLGLGLGFSMLGWLVPLFWNRRAVALGAPGFWAVWGRCVRRWTWAIAVVVTVMFLARAIEGFRAARAWQETSPVTRSWRAS